MDTVTWRGNKIWHSVFQKAEYDHQAKWSRHAVHLTASKKCGQSVTGTMKPSWVQRLPLNDASANVAYFTNLSLKLLKPLPSNGPGSGNVCRQPRNLDLQWFWLQKLHVFWQCGFKEPPYNRERCWFTFSNLGSKLPGTWGRGKRPRREWRNVFPWCLNKNWKCQDLEDQLIGSFWC